MIIMAAPLQLVYPYIYPTLSLSTASLSTREEFYNLLINTFPDASIIFPVTQAVTTRPLRGSATAIGSHKP
jgi:hypothetical protein